jgi:hypothetical protein
MSFGRRTIWCATATTALLAIALPAAAATTPGAAQPSGRVAEATASGRQAASAAASGSDDFFDGNSCVRGGFCMAVGSYTLSGAQVGLSEMLSGGTWTTEPVPSPTTGPNVFGNEVSCTSPTNCLFVGWHWAGKNGRTSNLAEAWNGSSWRIVATAGPAKSTASGLNDVACPTTKFCLVVGNAGPANHYQDTAYTWNGSTLKRISVPKPGGARWSELAAVACSSSTNCLAVGNYDNRSGRNVSFAARWHKGRWQLLTIPAIHGQRFAFFEGISCATSTLCMAVGQTEDTTREEYYHAFAEEWSGGKWHLSTLGRKASFFYNVSCPSRTRCFAAGYGFPSLTSFAHALIETWNGRTWSSQRPVETAAPSSGDVMTHVSCVTSLDCETAGFSFNPGGSNSDQTLAEQWDGHGWALQTTVSP